MRRQGNIGCWDVVAMCLPTCPLRTSDHLREAMNVFIANRNKSSFLVGVTQYDFPPQLALTMGSDGVSAVPVDSGAYANTRSQDINPLYHPNGSVYIADVEAYLKRDTFFGPDMLAHVLPQEASLDIDYEYQFVLIESFLKYYERTQVAVNG